MNSNVHIENVQQLTLKEKRRALKKAILKANREEANDVSYQQELAGWDHTLADGLGPFSNNLYG